MTLVSRVSSFSYCSTENCFLRTLIRLSTLLQCFTLTSLPCGSKNFMLKFVLLPLFLLFIAALAVANLLLLKLLFGILRAAGLILGMTRSYK